MKTSIASKDESGQILVILTIGIVGLLGLLALAIDGGMIYADRRYDQNAADASSFAGGGAAAMRMENQQIYHTNFSCSSTEVQGVMSEAKLVAINRAQSNLFTIEPNINNQHGVEVNCHIPSNPFAPRYLDVYTMISSELQTAFAHLFYQGPVRNTVDATVRVVVGGDAGYGYALATLSDKCDEGLTFKGGGKGVDEDGISVHLKGAGAHSNSCITRSGKFKVISEKNATYFSNSGYKDSGNGWIKKDEGASTQNVSQLAAKIDRPNFDEIASFCADTNYSHPVNAPFEAYKELPPGTYTDIVVANNQTLVLKSGLYCIKDKLVMTTSSGTLIGEGVTIVLLDNAFLKINSGKTTLTATSDANKSYQNLLIYAVTGNNKTHNILGNAESYYQGSMLFPYATLEYGGSSGSAGNKVQVIANHIWLHGGGTLLMDYDSSAVWRFPSLVSLVK
jgi:hypothetical protein